MGMYVYVVHEWKMDGTNIKMGLCISATARCGIDAEVFVIIHIPTRCIRHHSRHVIHTHIHIIYVAMQCTMWAFVKCNRSPHDV